MTRSSCDLCGVRFEKGRRKLLWFEDRHYRFCNGFCRKTFLRTQGLCMMFVVRYDKNWKDR